MEKQLYPRPDDWKRARLIQRDGEYVVQTRYNEDTKSFEEETTVSIDEECAELVAFNLYTDLFNKAITDKLQARDNFKEHIQKTIEKQEETENDKNDTVPCVWANSKY